MDMLSCLHLFITIVLLGFKTVLSEDDGTLVRHKRDARDCKDKFKVLRTHSACKLRSSQFKSGGVNTTEQGIILQEHNGYRRNVTPAATNMMKMTWDNETAEIAQAWAETCSFGHDKNEDRNIPGRFSLGQNIGKGYTSWPDAIKDWWAEKKDFQYGVTKSLTNVGHYTQLVWATSNKIGCGMAVCGNYAFHVCNYGPAGNIGNTSTPYEFGMACSKCSNCSNTLCDCGDKVCESGGILHPNNCSCTCKQPSFQVGDQCKLDCSNLTEPYKCGGKDWDAVGCKKYSNVVPNECPKTCGICPYGAYNYKEQHIKIDDNSSFSPVPSGVSLLIVMFSLVIL